MTQINETVSSDKQALDVAAALQKFDRKSLAQLLKKAEEERQQVLERFPLEAWPTMPLERYALGLGIKDSFSWWMEWGTEELGSISGGSSEKHLIYKHKTRGWLWLVGDRQDLCIMQTGELRSTFSNAITAEVHSLRNL